MSTGLDYTAVAVDLTPPVPAVSLNADGTPRKKRTVRLDANGKPIRKKKKIKNKLKVPEHGWATSTIEGFKFRDVAIPQPSDFNDHVSGLSVLHCDFMLGQYQEQMTAYYSALKSEIGTMTPEQRREAGEMKRQMTMARKAVETHGIKVLVASLDNIKSDQKAEVEALMAQLAAKLASM